MSITKKLILALPLIALGTTFAASTPHKSVVKYPKYQFLRYNEDWSVLKEASPAQMASCPWNKFKYIPLKISDTSWLSLGGHMRYRFEGWDHFGFNQNNDDGFNLWRILAHADMHFSKYFRVYVEGKSALSSDRDLPGGIRALDEDTGALQQAFFDLNLYLKNDTVFTLRGGRQMLSFGKQRLVSPLPWANTLRTWQGFSGIIKSGPWNIHSFYTQYVPVRQRQFNVARSDNSFSGVYATRKVPQMGGGFDLYWLYLNRDHSAFQGVTTRAAIFHGKRHTLGARLFGNFNTIPFDYDIEGAYQFGTWYHKDISAFMFASVLGHTFKQVGLKPRITAGFDYASGGDPAGRKMKTFNQLFPLGHAFLGYIDVIGRQNIIDAHAGLSISPLEKMVMGANYHQFWRANSLDALYNAGGGIVRTGRAGSSNRVGGEVDMYLKKQCRKHIALLVGYSHFYPGRFIRQTGPDSSINFGYAQIQYTV